jgi:hypothetical protein
VRQQDNQLQAPIGLTAPHCYMQAQQTNSTIHKKNARTNSQQNVTAQKIMKYFAGAPTIPSIDLS